MLTINFTQEQKNQLEIIAQNKGFSNIEEYIKYLLKRDSNNDCSQKNINTIIANLHKLESGNIFSINDLVELEHEEKVSVEIIQELENIFEIYLTKSNQLQDYVILFLDEKTLTYTYLKK